MINLSTLPTAHIPLMSEINMQNSQVLGKPFLKAVNDFTVDGERQTWCICKIETTAQNTLDKKTGIWSQKTETVTKFNPKTGKETTVTTSVKGFVLELYKKDDPDCVVRRLAINAKAGVQYMEKYVAERKAPLTEYIPEEDLILEKVSNGEGYYPSILPIGA
tara:strand:- start:34 stop:519 length:486 start_codon:yes stop_codon:yes gene_type:complete